MAIYHHTTKIITRSKGRSAIRASAYISGEKIKNEHDGITYDYRKKKGIVYTEIQIPKNAPEWAKDRQQLWNEVEKIEKAKNSQLAREVECALPIELTSEQQIELAREYIKETFVKKGMVADLAIHDKGDGNPHCHIILTMRPFDENGEWGTKSKKEYILDENGYKIKLKSGEYKSKKIDSMDWNTKESLLKTRIDWAEMTNKALEKYGHKERIDHRSFKDQGIERQPTIHEGVAARQIQKRGEKSYMIEKNKLIKEENKLLEKINNEIAQLERMKEQKLMELNKEDIEKEDNLFKEKDLEQEHKSKDNSIVAFEEKNKVEIKHRDSHKDLAESREERGSITRLEGEANSIADLQNNYMKIQAIENKRQADIKELKNINLDIEKHEKNIEELKKQRERAKGIMKASLRKSLDKDIAEEERIIKLKEQHLRDKHQIHNKEQLTNRIKDLSNESSNRQEERISISQKLQQLKKQQDKDKLKETTRAKIQERTR